MDVASFVSRSIAASLATREIAKVESARIEVDGRAILREMVADGRDSILAELAEKERNDEITQILNGLRQDFATLGTLIAGETEPERQDQLAAALSNRFGELLRLQSLIRESTIHGPVRLAARETRRTNPGRSRLSELLTELDAAGGQPTYDRAQYFSVLRMVGVHLHSLASNEGVAQPPVSAMRARKPRRKRA